MEGNDGLLCQVVGGGLSPGLEVPRQPLCTQNQPSWRKNETNREARRREGQQREVGFAAN